jgi:hypothetical protein
MLNNRKFPTSSQEFERIIQKGFIYVDKTRFSDRLYQFAKGTIYFWDASQNSMK